MAFQLTLKKLLGIPVVRKKMLSLVGLFIRIADGPLRFLWMMRWFCGSQALAQPFSLGFAASMGLVCNQEMKPFAALVGL